MRGRILLVVALVAGCKGRHAPVEQSAGSAAAKVHVVATPLPTVPPDARLAPASDPVPAHALLIDAAGRIAAFSSGRTWSDVIVQADAEEPLDLEGLENFGKVVHRKRKDAYDAKVLADAEAAEQRELEQRIADGATEAEAREAMSHVMYEPALGRMGVDLFADRPVSAIPAHGDGLAVREGVPVRVPKLTAIASDTYAPEPFLFVAARTAPAALLVDALIATRGGMIAIAAPDGVRALRPRFKHIDPGKVHVDDVAWAPWIELRIGSGGAIEVEAVPGTPIRLPDTKALLETIANARARRPSLAADQTVDVLVGDGADVQRLVDVLAALDLANVSEIGLGRVPRASEGDALRGKPLAVVPVPAIELDPGEGGTVPVREMIVAHMDAIRGCFAQATTSDPVVIHAKKAGGAVRAELGGKPTPLASCILGQLEAPFAQQNVAFTVRFARIE